jgi:hypothetical protein
MQESFSTRFSVSYHLKDLLKRDAQTVREIANWLEVNAEKPRDRSRKVSSRRMMARLIAAKQLLAATEDTVAAREVMDRTEGRVANVLVTGSFDDLVQALELGRQRLLASRPQPVIEGQVIEPQLVAVSDAVIAPENQHPEPL